VDNVTGRERMTPIALSNEQLDHITDLCQLLTLPQRDQFLIELATRLRDVEIGDGAVHRIAQSVFRDVRSRR
jgi:hypothetical protein